jgi:haloalkane dehalogenase
VNDAAAISAPAWLARALYPFARQTFATAEGCMHYVDEGAGRPVLFVHGTPSWSFEWRAAIAALKDQARCVAPDHLGFGLSDKPAGAAYKPADHAQRLLAFVRALDLREITLVLHDFGGPIGLPVLLEEPARVRALVVVNSWAWAHGADPKIARLSKLVASPLGRFLYLSLNASPRFLVPSSLVQRAGFTQAVHRHYLAPFATRAERTAPWVLGCELAGSDAYYASLWERREALQRVPVTLVWGMRDPAFGATYLGTWRQALPHARVHELADVGHFPQEEAPEALNRALREALS